MPGAVLELIERDDGFIDGGDAARYFARPDAWDALDRLACAEARGRILDVGAGAGRAALYLQETGHDVVALAASSKPLTSRSTSVMWPVWALDHVRKARVQRAWQARSITAERVNWR